jgi:hypothetical protein
MSSAPDMAEMQRQARELVDRTERDIELTRKKLANNVRQRESPQPTSPLPTTSTQHATQDAAPWPDALAESAYQGLFGDIARAIEPDTESDPAAILVQVIVAFGALVGRGPHVRVEGDEHHLNLFIVLAGDTSKARKGTSWSRVRELFSQIRTWPRVVNGLSSGEGLKYHVRDAIMKLERDKRTGRTEEVLIDPGVDDKRLLVVESEFAQVLRQGARAGNTLSATIRAAWDTGVLMTLTKNDPITATGAHISIIGHITIDELRSELTATDSANGFANRFLFMCVKRSKLLPFGGSPLSAETLQASREPNRESSRACTDATSRGDDDSCSRGLAASLPFPQSGPTRATRRCHGESRSAMSAVGARLRLSGRGVCD